MSWNYRIIKHDTTKPVHFAVHEVYYNEKGSITGWTADPIAIVGDNTRNVASILRSIASDIKQPVLKEAELDKQLAKQ